MKDNLSNIRKLPKAILNSVNRLIIDRLGADTRSFMQTKDIVGYFSPGKLYKLTDISNVDQETKQSVYNLEGYEDLSFGVIKIDNTGSNDLLQTLEMHNRQKKVPPPKHICIEGHWDAEEFIKVTNANLLGGMGTFIVDGQKIEVPIINATNQALAFYDSYLIRPGNAFSLESADKLPVMLMEVGETYANKYLQKEDYGLGDYIEYHNQPHLWMPLRPDCKGFVLLGKKTYGKYFFTGFMIPYGTALYSSPYVLHADAYLTGEFLVVYMLASDYSTVLFKDKKSKMSNVIPDFREQRKTSIEDNEIFLDAVTNGDLPQINKLLESKKWQNSISDSDNAALRSAALNGHIHVVKRLLEFDAVKNGVAAFENGALALASRGGHLEIVELLLGFEDVRNNISAANNKSLAWAAANGYLRIVIKLLEFQDVQDLLDVGDNEIFREAVKNGQIDIVDYLLKFSVVKDNVAIFYNEALRHAIANGYLDIVNKLLGYKSVIKQIEEDCKNKDFKWIIKNGHIDIVNRLLELDIIRNNVSSLDNELLREVCAAGHLNVANRLLKFKEVEKNITASFNEALRGAAANGHLATVERLLEFKSVMDDVTAYDNGSFREAAKHGRLDVLSRLLEIEAVRENIAAADHDAFRGAVRNNHQEVIDKLLSFSEVNAYETKNKFRDKWKMANR